MKPRSRRSRRRQNRNITFSRKWSWVALVLCAVLLLGAGASFCSALVTPNTQRHSQPLYYGQQHQHQHNPHPGGSLNNPPLHHRYYHQPGPSSSGKQEGQQQPPLHRTYSPEVDDLARRIEIVRDAAARHEALGELDHVAGAREVLAELQEELDELLYGGSTGGFGSDVELAQEARARAQAQQNKHCGDAPCEELDDGDGENSDEILDLSVGADGLVAGAHASRTVGGGQQNHHRRTATLTPTAMKKTARLTRRYVDSAQALADEEIEADDEEFLDDDEEEARDASEKELVNVASSVHRPVGEKQLVGSIDDEGLELLDDDDDAASEHASANSRAPASLRDIDEDDETQVLVVATIDGNVYGLDADSGEQLWRFHAGKAVISSHQSDQQLGTRSTSVMIPGTDGSIFTYELPSAEAPNRASSDEGVNYARLSDGADSLRDPDEDFAGGFYDTEEGGADTEDSSSVPSTSQPAVRRFPLDVSQLVAMFSLQAAGPLDASSFFMGEKTTTLFGLDATTGTLRARLSAGDEPDQHVDDAPPPSSSSSVATRDGEGKKNILWLGRTDYRVRLLDQTGLEQWNFSISQYDSPSGTNTPSGFLPGSAGGLGAPGAPGSPGGFHAAPATQRFDPLELLVTKTGKIARYYCTDAEAAEAARAAAVAEAEEAAAAAVDSGDTDTAEPGGNGKPRPTSSVSQCDLPRWTVELANPVSQMLTFPGGDASQLQAQAFTLWDEDEQSEGDSASPNAEDETAVDASLADGVCLSRLPDNGLFAVVNSNAHLHQQSQAPSAHGFPFLGFDNRLQIAGPGGGQDSGAAPDSSAEPHCLYGVDGYCLIHSHSASLYNLYANPLQRQYQYQLQYNEGLLSRYYGRDWPGDGSRPTGFVPKKQVLMLMTAMLSLGVIVTLLGVVATRYWRRIRRRRDLNLPPGYVQIGQGQLAYSPAMLIGQGCNGTMVYKGLLGNQEVAVKKMLKAFYNTADREIELLMSTNHPNVLRYFQRVDSGDFIHLALELCEMSLSDALEERPELFAIIDDPSNPPRLVRSRRSSRGSEGIVLQQDGNDEDDDDDELFADDYDDDWVVLPSKRYVHLPAMVPHILRDMVHGVAHLHDMRIVHRDLKPQNVLLGKYVSKDKLKKQKQQLEQHLAAASAAASSVDSAGVTIGDGLVCTDDDASSAASVSAPAVSPKGPSGDDILSKGGLVRKFSSASGLLLGAADTDEDWGRTHRAKISDMGLGKQLQGELSSFGHRASVGASNVQGMYNRSKSYRRRHLGVRRTSSGLQDNGMSNASSMANVGTIGWQAPEVLLIRNQNISSGSRSLHREQHGQGGDEDEEAQATTGDDDDDDDESGNEQQYRLTRAVDIFSLGCIFFATAVPGCHPFGAPLERQQNILKGKRDLSKLDRAPELQDLVAKMTHHLPLQRPTATDLENHPFFWQSAKVLNFLQDVSDAIEGLQDIDHSAVRLLESHARRVIGGDGRWDTKLDAELRGDVGRHKSYDRLSLRSCLRMIRNKRHHFNELPASIKPKLEPLPDGFLAYFTAPSRYPLLVTAVYNTVLNSSYLRKHSLLVPYLPASVVAAPDQQPSPVNAGEFESLHPDAEGSGGLGGECNHRHDAGGPDGPGQIHGGAGELAGCSSQQPMHWFPDADSWVHSLSDEAALAAQAGTPAAGHATMPRAKGGAHSMSMAAAAAAVVVLQQRVPEFVQRQRAIRGGARYKCKLCAEFEASGGLSCTKGDDCGYAHGPHELRPQRTKPTKAKRNSNGSTKPKSLKNAVKKVVDSSESTGSPKGGGNRPPKKSPQASEKLLPRQPAQGGHSPDPVVAEEVCPAASSPVRTLDGVGSAVVVEYSSTSTPVVQPEENVAAIAASRSNVATADANNKAHNVATLTEESESTAQGETKQQTPGAGTRGRRKRGGRSKRGGGGSKARAKADAAPATVDVVSESGDTPREGGGGGLDQA